MSGGTDIHQMLFICVIAAQSVSLMELWSEQETEQKVDLVKGTTFNHINV